MNTKLRILLPLSTRRCIQDASDDIQKIMPWVLIQAASKHANSNISSQRADLNSIIQIGMFPHINLVVCLNFHRLQQTLSNVARVGWDLGRIGLERSANKQNPTSRILFYLRNYRLKKANCCNQGRTGAKSGPGIQHLTGSLKSRGGR